MNYFGIDIGNSGCRVANFDMHHGEIGTTVRIDWRFQFASPSQANRSRYAPDSPHWLHELAAQLEVAPATWLISSVRRDATGVIANELDRLGRQAQVLTHADLPIRVGLPEPAKIGVDRLLAALAAGKLAMSRQDSMAPERMLVIQAGSAVTVDLIGCDPTSDPELSFEGGAIVPGVPMMLRLLGRGADMLPELEADDLTDLPPIPGLNTEQAMLCGTASALVGGVSHLVGRYRAKFGDALPVILSGGDGMRLAPYIPKPLTVQPDLVQRGLLFMAQAISRPTSSP